jgi:response regulator RpfG family c-di-GMP phosphodiesterase
MNRTLLMLEHDDDDRYITQAVFDENRAGVNLKFVGDSKALMYELQLCGTRPGDLPSLIILNYHASPSNAVEILKLLKAENLYRHIPVVVVSGGAHPEMVRECYFYGASSFIQKPSREVERTISFFIRYWFETVQLA